MKLKFITNLKPVLNSAVTETTDNVLFITNYNYTTLSSIDT